MAITWGYFNPSQATSIGKQLWSLLLEAQKEKRGEYKKGLGLYNRLTSFYGPSGGFYPQLTGAATRSAKEGTPYGLRGGTTDTRTPISPVFARQLRDEQMKNYISTMQQRSAYQGKYVPIYPSGEAIGSLVGAGTTAELAFWRGVI